jgi:hypothetical protein
MAMLLQATNRQVAEDSKQNETNKQQASGFFF